MTGIKEQLRVLAIFQRRGVTIHDYLFSYLWKNYAIRTDCVAIEEVTPEHFQSCDLVMNAICNDVLGDELKQIEYWAARAGKLLLNGYEGLHNCRRTRAARIWQEHGIQCARTEQVASKKDLLALDLQYPLILRGEYTHKGSTMQLINSREEAEAMDIPLESAGSVIAIEYHDYRNDDGFFRKYRCALIGDRLVPRHVFSSPDWNVHGESIQPERVEELLREHREFCNNEIREARSLFRARDLLGLDYCIVDYTREPDGSPFIFELNPCYNICDPRIFRRELNHQIDPVHHYCNVFAEFLLKDQADQKQPDFIRLPMIL